MKCIISYIVQEKSRLMMSLDKSRITLNKVNEAKNWFKKSPAGTHTLLTYPDLMTLRRIYPQYAKTLLEERNEIVLILPYYETTEMVRLALSGAADTDGSSNSSYSGIDVRKYERDGSLIIMDSLKGYFPSGKQSSNDNNEDRSKGNLDFISFLDVLLKQAERRGKNGVTVLSDTGSFHHHREYGTQNLVEYEQSLPKTFVGKNLKGFCLYHQKDFERRFNQEQQASLLDCHSQNIILGNFK
jgi:MEDS: MEthanogen/methylotroph, DcmR Sensory domain